MDAAEKHVQQLFRELFCLALVRAPEQNVPTADFEILEDARRVAAVELKTFHFGDCSEVSLDATDEDLVTGVLAVDNGVERVGNAINKAARQLRGYECSKVLVLLNLDETMDVSDLNLAYRGWASFVNDDGSRSIDRSAARIANGRIMKKKRLIDVFVWIDGWHGNPKILFRGEQGRLVAERLFRYTDSTSNARDTHI